MTTSSTTTVPRATEELLAEAAEWRLLALLFSCPVDGWREQVAAIAAEVGDAKLREAAETAIGEAAVSIYHTAFGPGGPGAPREVSHRQSALSGQYLAELRACYDVFAYQPPRDEPPDHVATEIDYLAYLRLKQAYAVSRGDDAQATVAADAAQHFLDEHLATIAGPLAKIAAASSIRYLELAATALVDRVGPPRTRPGGSVPPFSQLSDPALPICELDDCCGEFADE